MLMADAILQQRSSLPPKQKNLTPVEINYDVNRRNRVALILAPEWSFVSAPYGPARLASLSRASGFATRVWDLNILCRTQGPKEYWTQYADWKWNCDAYWQEIHPKIEPLLLKFLDELMEWAPTIVGFTMYYTNDLCSTWLMQQIRHRHNDIRNLRRRNNLHIIAGGPQATQEKISRPDLVDHIIQGEGELLFLKVLENIESNAPKLPAVLIQDKAQRIDLDSMPPADYRDFDISLYEMKGISSEFSRGCIAQCQFCSETTFWKFRGRQGSRVLEEIEINYRNHGIEVVWFIDSLVNGNLRELREFARGIIDRKIKIAWTGYARCDGRMDLEYLLDLKRSGAWGFAFGMESGSQRVLDLIKKKVKVAEIEDNFLNMEKIGLLCNFGSWFVGFPGEDLTDVAQTMTLMWRLRRSALSEMTCGVCAINPDTPLNLERQRFGIRENHFAFEWATEDLRNTKFHRFIRFKLVNILLENFRLHGTHRSYNTTPAFANLKNHYTLISDPKQWQRKIPWEIDFNYHIIDCDINPLADQLVNEIWPLLRVFWLALGAFKITITFDPEQDLADFATYRYPVTPKNRFVARYWFSINEQGAWSADFDIDFTHEPDQFLDWATHDFAFAWQGQGHWLPQDRHTTES